SPEFESAACALCRITLRALDESSIWRVLKQPLLQRNHIDAFFCAAADHWHVDGGEQMRAVLALLDDGQAATNARIKRIFTPHLHQIATDKIAPESAGGMHHDEAAGGKIHDEVAGLGDGTDQSGDQADRLNMRVNAAIDLLRPVVANRVVTPRSSG